MPKEVLEERAQKREITRNDSDTHLHVRPTAGIDLGVRSIVRCEAHDGSNSDSAGDADTFNSLAMSHMFEVKKNLTSPQA